MKQRAWRVGLLALGLAAAGHAGLRAQATAPAAAAGVTFSKDIAPIFQQKCQTCHRPGSLGPMPLVTYEEARPWARSIRNKVLAREMPPWHLDKTVGIQAFINDISLSDAQIETIAAWVDAGAPRGDPADLPPPVDWPAGDRFLLEDTLGPPDLVIRSKPWTMPAVANDVFFHAVVDVPLTAARWIRAAETKPSLPGRRIAHHASTYLHQPESDDFIEAELAFRNGQAGIEAVLAAQQHRASAPVEVRELFTEWAQGKEGEVYPPDTGKLVKPGAKVEFDIHYHAVGEEITDVLEVGWWFHPEGTTPRYSAEYLAFGPFIGGELEIPPHTVAQHQGSYVLPGPAILHNFQPHMHARGKALLLEAVYPSGGREIINYTDRFDNNWHINYIYAEDAAPLLPKGTVLLVTTWHDNTAANRNNPDPRQWVLNGPRTIDEMGHVNAQMIFISDEDYERIARERAAAGEAGG